MCWNKSLIKELKGESKMLDDYYDYPSDVEEMFNELSRYEIEHPDLLLEREETLEGDDLEVMIPDRGATLPSHRFYSGCADEESETESPLSENMDFEELRTEGEE